MLKGFLHDDHKKKSANALMHKGKASRLSSYTYIP